MAPFRCLWCRQAVAGHLLGTPPKRVLCKLKWLKTKVVHGSGTANKNETGASTSGDIWITGQCPCWDKALPFLQVLHGHWSPNLAVALPGHLHRSWHWHLAHLASFMNVSFISKRTQNLVPSECLRLKYMAPKTKRNSVSLRGSGTPGPP